MEETVKKSFKLNGVLIIVFTILLLAVIGLFVYEYFRIAPSNVYFTNVSSSSVTVSWSTKTPISSSVMVTEGEKHIPVAVVLEGEKFFDTRDVTNAELLAAQQTARNMFENDSLTATIDDFETDIIVTDRGSYYTHHVTVKGLDPETEYSFLVGDRYLFRSVTDVNDLATVKTLEVLDEVLTPVPAYGSVLDANNEEEVPFDELYPVYDGVMYFNYLDEFTDERSEVYSSSLNSSGNWYMDVSGILDSNGDLFMDRYDTTVTNILVELVIDSGPWGIWKKVVYLGDTSPTDDIVINMPDATQDAPDSVVKVDSLTTTEVVKGVSAAQDSSCLWVGYCSCGFYSNTENKWLSCPCDANKLKARNCSGQTDPQKEADSYGTCAGNAAVGKCTYFQNSCRECTRPGSSQPLWQAVAENKCGDNKSSSVFNCTDQIVTPPVTETPTDLVTECTRDDVIASSACKLSDDTQGVCVQSDLDEYYFYCGRDGEKEASLIFGDSQCRGKTVGSSCNGQGGEYTCQELSSYMYCKKTSEETPLDTPLVIRALCSQSEAEVIGTYNSLSNQCNCPSNSSFIAGTGCLCISNYTASNDRVSCQVIITPSTTGCWEEIGIETAKIEEEKTFVCRNNRWIETSSPTVAKRCEDLASGLANNANATNIKCPSKGDLCYLNNSTYYCDSDKWINYENLTPNEKPKLLAGVLVKIQKGEICPDDQKCLCGDDVRYSGNYCEEVEFSCLSQDSIGKICNQLGNTCKKNDKLNVYKFFDNENSILRFYQEDTQNDGKITCIEGTRTCYTGMKNNSNKLRIPSTNNPIHECTGDQPSNDLTLVRPNTVKSIGQIQSSLFSFVNPTFAQSPSSQYLIDSQTGMIEGIEVGTYVFEYEDELYSFDVSSIDLERNDSVLIYIDKDGNGEYDEITDLKVSDIASMINIVTLEKQYRYSLEEGLNFISLPFLISSEEYRTASALLQKLNEVYGDKIYSISKYDGTWKIVGQNTQVYDNNDFQLLPGQGYIFKAKEDVDIVINGKPVQYESVSDSAPISLYTGWNLVGIYGTKTKSYTAKTLIQGINSYEPIDFTSDNVTRWQSDTQRYDGLQLSEEDGSEKEYGFDYPINQLESYFVRITKGRGNWQPEIAQ